MKERDVKLGSVYAIKVNGKVQPVRIERTYERTVYKGGYGRGLTTRTGWMGTNINSGREIHIRSAAKLRYELVKAADGIATGAQWRRA